MHLTPYHWGIVKYLNFTFNSASADPDKVILGIPVSRGHIVHHWVHTSWTTTLSNKNKNNSTGNEILLFCCVYYQLQVSYRDCISLIVTRISNVKFIEIFKYNAGMFGKCSYVIILPVNSVQSTSGYFFRSLSTTGMASSSSVWQQSRSSNCNGNNDTEILHSTR